MLYMIIENFKQGKVKEVYERFEKKGRMLPDGVSFIDSWIDENVTKCFQIMESDDIEKINKWISNWSDLTDFEIVPVIKSKEAHNKIMN